MVIVILGILAVTAAPRFLYLQGDAREASLEGLRDAVAGAMGISYGRAAIKGIETLDYTAYTDANTPGTVIDGIAHKFGYPTAVNDSTANLGGIMQTLDTSSEFIALQSSTGTNSNQANLWIDKGFNGYNDHVSVIQLQPLIILQRLLCKLGLLELLVVNQSNNLNMARACNEPIL